MAGPILGFRAWEVFCELGGQQLRLWPTGAGRGSWVPGDSAARCLSPHRVPHPACSCGFYAWRSPEVLVEMWGHEVTQVDQLAAKVVFGGVAMWGRVMPHEFGYRSQFARPAFLIRTWGETAEDRMLDVASLYDVEIWDYPEFALELLQHGYSWVGQHRSLRINMIETSIAIANAFEQAITKTGTLARAAAVDLLNLHRAPTSSGSSPAPKQPPWASMNQPSARSAFRKRRRS